MTIQVNREMIAAASGNHSQLNLYKHHLYNEKMKLDKFFTTFIDNQELDPTTPDSMEWFTYHSMFDTYTDVKQLLNITEYYINHGK